MDIRRKKLACLAVGLVVVTGCDQGDGQQPSSSSSSGGNAPIDMSTGGSDAASGGAVGTEVGGNAQTGGATGSGGAPAGESVLHLTLDTTVAGADVSDSVQNYPLAVALDATHFDFSASATGEDLRFVQGTTALDYEIELWEPESQVALVWVKVPEIQGNMSDQTIDLFYGSGTPNAENDPAAVFSTEAGFYGVFHLGEDGNTTPGGYHDSSGHGAHATGIDMIPGSSVMARLGRGSHLDNPVGQDTARYIQVSGDKASAFNPDGPLTVSVWALAYSYPIYSYETIMSKGDTSWSLQRVTYDPNTGYQSCLLAGSGDTYHFCIYDFEDQPLVTEEWLHFQLVLNEPNMTLFINGRENATGSGSDWNQGDHPLGIGNQTQFDGRRQWDGILDEARVMRAARSSSWAKLDYESQKQGQTLITFSE